MYSLKDELDEIFFGAKNPKTLAKKKLNKYYDIYGENQLDIENALSDAEYREYFMVSGYADEVLEERRQAREVRKNQSLLSDDAAKKKDEENISEEKQKYRSKNDHKFSNKDALYLAIKLGKFKDTDKFNRLIDSVFEEEGGYENNKQKIDQETNMGIIQSTLDRFNRSHPELKINKKLFDLTKNDAKLIYNLDYYSHYRIEEIDDDGLAKLVLHMYVNGNPKDVGTLIQQSIIDFGKNVKVDGIVGTDTIKVINRIIKDGQGDVFKKILSRNRVNFENKLKDSHKYPGRKKRFERLGQ